MIRTVQYDISNEAWHLNGLRPSYILTALGHTFTYKKIQPLLQRKINNLRKWHITLRKAKYVEIMIYVLIAGEDET